MKMDGTQKMFALLGGVFLLFTVWVFMPRPTEPARPADKSIQAVAPAKETFPVIGATYQLDRAKFPGEIAVCTTEDAMADYIAATRVDEQRAMLFEIETMEDVAKMKQAGGCTMVSSYSQATIIEKGTGSHRAKFAAFPFEPMWGYYEYFGGVVR